MSTRAPQPETIEEAVRLLLSTAPLDQRAKIVAMRKEDLIGLHFTLGRWIRNNFGLMNGESALLLATGAADPDAASMAIIQALWQQLRDDLAKSD